MVHSQRERTRSGPPFDHTGDIAPLDTLRASTLRVHLLVDNFTFADFVARSVESNRLRVDSFTLDDSMLFADEVRDVLSEGWIESPIRVMVDSLLTPQFVRERIL